jgi:hypothetical protein
MELVWIFPTPMVNEKGESYSEVRKTIYVTVNDYCFSSYLFEKDYEILPGTWTFQLYDKSGKKAFEQKFNVKATDKPIEEAPTPDQLLIKTGGRMVF